MNLVPTTASTTLAQIFIEYDVDFKDAIIQTGSLPAVVSGVASLTGSLTAWDGSAVVTTFNSGATFVLSGANLGNALTDPNGIYECFIVIAAGSNGTPSNPTLGVTSETWTMTPGQVFFLKRDTNANVWFMYGYMPDDSKEHGENVEVYAVGYAAKTWSAGSIAFYQVGTLAS